MNDDYHEFMAAKYTKIPKDQAAKYHERNKSILPRINKNPNLKTHSQKSASNLKPQM